MLKYLLDTNIVSETTRAKPNENILKRFKRHKDEIAIPAIGWHELWYGVNRLEPSRKRTILEEFLNDLLATSIPILPYDDRAAEWHAAERARLSRLGKTPAFADGQIAAIAYVNDLILVTLNVSDYASFNDLQVESWK